MADYSWTKSYWLWTKDAKSWTKYLGWMIGISRKWLAQWKFELVESNSNDAFILYVSAFSNAKRVEWGKQPKINLSVNPKENSFKIWNDSDAMFCEPKAEAKADWDI